MLFAIGNSLFAFCSMLFALGRLAANSGLLMSHWE
jgi:hypothetical protein